MMRATSSTKGQRPIRDIARAGATSGCATMRASARGCDDVAVPGVESRGLIPSTGCRNEPLSFPGFTSAQDLCEAIFGIDSNEVVDVLVGSPIIGEHSDLGAHLQNRLEVGRDPQRLFDARLGLVEIEAVGKRECP